MIRKAKIEDLHKLSKMLMNMYLELQPEHATKDFNIYKEMMNEYFINDTVLIDDQNRGMFIMRDETPKALDFKMWNGIVVYIYPEFRHTRVLKDMYDYMFKNFKGVIMGYTEANSPHNEVLLKRHKLIGLVYKLNREV